MTCNDLPHYSTTRTCAVQATSSVAEFADDLVQEIRVKSQNIEL